MPVWSFEPVVSVRGYLLCFLCLLFVALPSFISANESLIELHYQIDRSELPTLNDQSLTLLISVGDANDIAVFDQFQHELAFEHLADKGQIVVTSEATEIHVELLGVTEFAHVGTVEKARLRDNKTWAWSHAFDDNHYLENQINVMLEHGLPATMYVVGDWIDTGHSWEGDLTAEELHELMAAGWSVGNHTAEHDNNCAEQPSQAERRESILTTDQILSELIESSPNPDYKVLSFAVPCGGNDRFAAYHELILEMRDAQETHILFSEGGHDKPLHIEVASPFDFDQPIKRDLSIDGSSDNGAEIMAIFDSMHANDQPIWYNSFSHNEHLFGDNTQKLDDIATYFVDTYGKNGTNEAWMAPADVIYSYLLNRDLAKVSLISNTAPSPTPTVIPTSEPATPMPLPLPTVTPSPTEDAGAGGRAEAPTTFLPLVTNK